MGGGYKDISVWDTGVLKSDMRVLVPEVKEYMYYKENT